MSKLFVVESTASRNSAWRLRTSYLLVLLILALAFWLRDARLIRHIELGAQGSQDISIACEQRTIAYRVGNQLIALRDNDRDSVQSAALDHIRRDLNDWKSSSTYVLAAAMEHSNDETPQYSPADFFRKAEELRLPLSALAEQAIDMYRDNQDPVSGQTTVPDSFRQAISSITDSYMANLPNYTQLVDRGIHELNADFFEDTSVKQEWAHKWTWILLAIVVTLVLFILEPTIRHITRQQQEEASMRADLNRLALVARTTKNAVVITDEKQEIRWVNDGFTRLTGYQLDEVLHKVPGHFLQCEKTDPQTVNYLRESLREGRECRVEILNRAKFGEEYWLDIEVQPLRDEKGAVIGFIAVETDITSSVKQRNMLAEKEEIARRALKSHEDLLAAAVQTSVIATDIEGNITLFSRGSENMLGYKAEEVLNLSPAIFHDQDEIQARARELSQEYKRPVMGFDIFVVKTREGGHDERKWTYRRKDGGALQVSLIVTAIRDENDEVTGYLGIATDITRMIEAENKMQKINEQLEKSFEHANRMAEQANAANIAKSEFLANMSHEIRTPMNGVIGMTSMLLDTPLNAEQRHFAEIVRESADSLLALINDILDFSKIEAGKLNLECIGVDVRHIMTGVCKIMRLRAEQKGLLLSVEIADEVPQWLLGDPSRLRQVVLNLLGNAIKFTLAGSVRVVIDIEKSDGEHSWLRFCVQDTGIGIESEKLNLLFNKFSQVDASTTREFGGTGLGLAICKQLVELMGGTIGVKSELHKGSEFWFVLPLLQSADSVAPPHGLNPVMRTSSLTSAADLRDCFLDYRFLLVEDNLVNQEVASGMLRKLGCRVDVVNHGKEAIEAIKTRHYDLILMDVQMPEMDGFEATQQIRSSSTVPDSRRHIPIIAMTAHAMDGDRDRCVAAGMNDYICKPIALLPMVNTIARCLGLDVMNNDQINESSEAQIDVSAPKQTLEVVFDAQKLVERFMGDAGLVAEIVADFLVQLPNETAVIRDAMAHGDFEQVAQRAHALRGAAANMDAEQLASIVAGIEAKSMTRDDSQMRQDFEQLEGAIARLVVELQNWLSAHEFGKNA